MTRKLTAATFATALAFAGVACDNDDAGDVGDDIDEGVDDVENEVDGE
jgi:hypothetical protein